MKGRSRSHAIQTLLTLHYSPPKSTCSVKHFSACRSESAAGFAMESNMGNGLETVKSEESGAEASSNSGSTTRKRYVNLRDHYPYDCERSHCSTAVRDAFLCPNSCCIQRLEQRQVNLEKELSRLDHSILLEVQHLITKVREDWGKSAA